MSSEDEEAKVEKSRQKTRARIDEERARQATERELHEKTVAAETEQAKSELDKVLEKLPEPERRQVRLRAYLHVLSGAIDTPSQLQAGVDHVALRLARYMVHGKV